MLKVKYALGLLPFLLSPVYAQETTHIPSLPFCSLELNQTAFEKAGFFPIFNYADLKNHKLNHFLANESRDVIHVVVTFSEDNKNVLTVCLQDEGHGSFPGDTHAPEAAPIPKPLGPTL